MTYDWVHESFAVTASIYFQLVPNTDRTV